MGTKQNHQADSDIRPGRVKDVSEGENLLPFWEAETPETVVVGELTWKLYPGAKRLQITRRTQFKGQDGTLCEKFRNVTIGRRNVPPEVLTLWEKFIGLTTNNEKWESENYERNN